MYSFGTPEKAAAHAAIFHPHQGATIPASAFDSLSKQLIE
jgi:hypothetical protein